MTSSLMTSQIKKVFRPLRTKRMFDFDANWCKSKVDSAYIVFQGPFSDDLDDVIIYDVIDENIIPAADEPYVGF